MNTILSVPSLVTALPWITKGALTLWVFLCCMQIFRLIRRRCQPPKEPDEKARDMIKHENDLMNHRLTWLLTAEGLLFTAVGFALSKDNPTIAPKLIPVLSFAGVTLAASASIVLDGADAAITRLSRRIPDEQKTDIIGYRGLPGFGLLSPWRLYPPMFIIAWYLISQIQ